MATYNYKIDRRYVAKDGRCPIKFWIRNANTSACIPMGYSVYPDSWDDAAGKATGRKDLEHNGMMLSPKAFTESVKADFAELCLTGNEIVKYKSSMNASAIRDRILQRINGGKSFDGAENGIFSTIDAASGIYNSKSFAIKMMGLKKWLTKVAGEKAGSMSWCNVTDQFVAKLKATMMSELSSNTASEYMSSFKTVYRYAIKHRLADPYDDPFEGVKIRRIPAIQRLLSIDRMREIWNTPLPNSRTRNISNETARKVFCLSFALCGMNVADIVRLTFNDISNGRVIIHRGKTGVALNIRLEPEAMSLIGELSEGRKTGRIIDLHSKGRGVIVVNHHLKKAYGDVTSYHARHTWATIAADLGIANEVIASGLGHQYGNAMTNIYARKSLRLLDEANRKILDYVQQTGEFEDKK